jgi:ABC-type glycerol-3-phosphate transport system substrate-binding protein
MSIRQTAVLMLVAVGLAGCGQSGLFQPRQQVAEEQIWLRTDGQSGRTNPALAAQFEADKAACTVPGGGIDRACMTSRAYILVPASQVEATAARLRAASSPN